ATPARIFVRSMSFAAFPWARALSRTAFHMKIFGNHDEATIQQLKRCAAAEPRAPAVLCADGHLGYSMPIGGVVAYRDHVSPSGVGYDIACGNLAVQTALRAADLDARQYRRIAAATRRRVPFGVGRRNG